MLFILQFNFLAMKNRTRQTGEGTVICTRPTLLTLAWASGRVLMSNPASALLVECSMKYNPTKCVNCRLKYVLAVLLNYLEVIIFINSARNKIKGN